MKIHNITIFILTIMLIGCWDNSSSPIIVNRLDRPLNIQIKSQDTERAYQIAPGKSLTLINLAKDLSFQEISLSSPEETTLTLKKSEIIAYLKRKERKFVIEEGLLIKVELK